ncbi:CaiB/BaiF CoA-transferase family protein [Sphingosinicella microcystinivorans]|nr:CaiB/BaiF CoA-transferase family protein [Sphingosinicella microcystinivorans]WBX86530.1 CaiB/BaiF CoA-transferase family protein [Sphingosinicella microcystinivorans]
MTGVLKGIKIIEFAGLGPCPFVGMMLADHGAEVIRVDRPGGRFLQEEAASRSRRSIVVDMKNPDGVKLLKRLCRTADGLIEGFRPGVMERAGLGPEVLLAENPKLVFGRITGWGQFGPLSQAAGHDINYIALSGALHLVGSKDGPPIPPVNMVGDFGGGGMLLAFGMVAALLGVKMGRPGQVIDAAMTDGSALLAAMPYGLFAAGHYRDERGSNMIDGGSHYYGCYECADGRFISIGSVEARFYQVLRGFLGISDDSSFDAQQDPAAWPSLKQKLSDIFKTRSSGEWCELLEGTDACFAPVMSMNDAPQHPHNLARGTFIALGNTFQPAPAPRFLATPAGQPWLSKLGADQESIMRELRDFGE